MINRLTIRPVIPKRIKRKLKKLKPLTGGEWEIKIKRSKFIRNEIKEFKSILRGQLKIIQNKKCAYCGLTLEETSRYEIEHFIPKGGEKRPKYPEHSFDLINLVLACNLCNSPEKKGMYDPIVEGTKSINYLDNEYKIVHPYIDNHELHYSWIGKTGAIVIQGLSNKGNESIRLFKLDSTVHSEARAKSYIYDCMLQGSSKDTLLRSIIDYNP